MELVMFTKMWKRIGECSVDETADYLSELGFDGADLTVREGGHVEPSAVRERLPAAIEAFAERDLSVPVITTQVTSPHDDSATEIFETADACGVNFLKLGYWTYHGFGSARDDIQEMRSDLGDLAEFTHQYDVTPAIHVHSGTSLTGDTTLMRDLLREYTPDEIGAYIDPGHMLIEGAGSGWELGMDLLAPHTQLVAVKDLGLYPRPGIGRKKATWERRTVPFTDGLVPWHDVFTHLGKMDYDGPVSMHGEYHVSDVSDLYAQVEADLGYLRDVIDKTI